MSVIVLFLCAAALLMIPGDRPRLAILRRPPRRRTVFARRRMSMSVMGSAAAVVLIGSVVGIHELVATVIMFGTVWTLRRKAARRRRHRTERESLIGGLETVIGELRVGAHPALACVAAAADCTGTVATAFVRASGRARLGGNAYAGLQVTDSPVSAELDTLARAWRVADEHGLALVGLLAAARGDIVARRRFRDRTEASLAGARATGTVLACLPAVGVALGQAMGASPLSVLFGGGLGGILLVVGAGLACAGLLWTNAITEKVCR
ncbi:type ii secretion system integral membrane subunit [Rhodococcus sp. G-MC3]|uniref:type II secretion system F family protein n=1 Tax=Rhodococcus sp. G-MC3 TaxID=3046209 RepID=UPI0024B8A036|nr:type ii secretion system integral membrane subunit [Rhodococcus sp. G-MC3]MDJ0393512.1 type ii secretion system integral membrane subunit [Rhodococcus sp. G-MC3]